MVVARGAARIFLRGCWNYGSKSYEKEKLLVIRIARKAHILWINSWLYSPRNLGSFQLNCDLVSLIFFHDDRKTQPPWLHVSAEFFFDLWFFSTVGKHISHVHVFFIFAKFKKRIKLLCAKLVVLTCLMRLKSSFAFFQFLWADFTNMPRVLALQLTTSDANATHICKMTLYEFHYRLTT